MMDDREVGPVSVPVVLSALVSDALSAMGALGGSTLSVAVQSMLRRRQAQARDILLEELQTGDKQLTDVGQVDEAAAIIYRYARAAQEGAARLNLRLMAKVISGQAQLGNLVADEFLYYADMLASLRREEVILIASLHRHRVFHDDGTVDAGQTWRKSCTELIPRVFKDEEELRAFAQGAARTGLLLAGATWDGLSDFATSSLMERLERLAPFEDALRREGVVP